MVKMVREGEYKTWCYTGRSGKIYRFYPGRIVEVDDVDVKGLILEGCKIVEEKKKKSKRRKNRRKK